MAKITWALPTIKWGPTAASDAMCADGSLTVLAGVGGPEILENSCELTWADGEEKEVKNIKGELVDSKTFAGQATLQFTVVGATLVQIGTILGLTPTGETGSKKITFNDTKILGDKSIKVIPEETGDILAEFAKCRVKTGIAYSGANGWNLPITVKPLKTATGGITLGEYTAVP